MTIGEIRKLAKNSLALDNAISTLLVMKSMLSVPKTSQNAVQWKLITYSFMIA